jgi:hypothetical protein
MYSMMLHRNNKSVDIEIVNNSHLKIIKFFIFHNLQNVDLKRKRRRADSSGGGERDGGGEMGLAHAAREAMQGGLGPQK